MQQPATQTFLFADLGGYTALTEAHGDEQAADVAASFCAIIRPLLAAYQAEEIKVVGDAVMVRVPQASDGILLARDILRQAGARHGALTVHIGMNTGPAVNRDGDWFGAAVNLAARVAAKAAAGETLLTETTRAAATDLPDLNLEERGATRFKNIAEPVGLYALTTTEDLHETLHLDPVCHMAIDPQQAPRSQTWRNVEYHFCSHQCADTFSTQPDSYVQAPAAPAPKVRRRPLRRLKRTR